MKINDPKYHKKYFTHENTIKFVFVGRLNSVKRIDKMYKFIEIISLSLPNHNIYLDLYGPLEPDFKNNKKALENEYKQLNIIFKGILQQKDVQSTLLQYDYYLQLSDIEGMAMSVVEAMTIGLIPIVTSVGEISYYAKDMYNCILCSTNDSISVLTNSFLQLENDL
jgi:glycosyltransferase involved in cell wall biosynthesis